MTLLPLSLRAVRWDCAAGVRVQEEAEPFRTGDVQETVPPPDATDPVTSQSPAMKSAVTVVSAVRGTLQLGEALPAQGPAVQAVKRLPAEVEAVRATEVPSRKTAPCELQAV